MACQACHLGDAAFRYRFSGELCQISRLRTVIEPERELRLAPASRRVNQARPSDLVNHAYIVVASMHRADRWPRGGTIAGVQECALWTPRVLGRSSAEVSPDPRPIRLYQAASATCFGHVPPCTCPKAVQAELGFIDPGP